MRERNTVSRCDLAIEAHEMLAAENENNFLIGGVSVTEEDGEFVKVTRVSVDNNEGASRLGKPIGRYITIEMPDRFYGRQMIYEDVCKICASEIKKLVDEKLDNSSDTVLVAGLGNRRITADALGPKVVGSLMVTRHLKRYVPNEIDERIRPVCAIAPGVLGTTGMETEEIIKSLTEKIGPKLVIVVDALCSGNVDRVNTTIQITDTGITPGGGVGNRRKTINSDTLGVPVIAIGVPTVVDAVTIAFAGFEAISEECSENGAFFNDDENRESSAREIFKQRFGNMIVAPKDTDSIVGDISSVIANGINIALHEGITLNDIDRYV